MQETLLIHSQKRRPSCAGRPAKGTHKLECVDCDCCMKSVYFPYTQKPIHVEKPLENVVFKSLTMKTIHGRKIFHTWEEIEKIAAANKYASIP